MSAKRPGLQLPTPSIGIAVTSRIGSLSEEEGEGFISVEWSTFRRRTIAFFLHTLRFLGNAPVYQSDDNGCRPLTRYSPLVSRYLVENMK